MRAYGNSLLSFLIMLLIVQSMSAQSPSIVGSRLVCPASCYTYQLVPSTLAGQSINWSVTDIGGNPIPFTFINDFNSAINVCWPEFGDYIITINEGEFSLLVFASEFTEVILEPISPLSCSEQTGIESCFKFCTGGIVTLRVRGIRVAEAQWESFGNISIISSTNQQVTIQLPDEPTNAFINIFGLTDTECQIFGSYCMDIIAPPIAGFNTFPESVNDTITLCRNQQVTFTNTSSASQINWFAGSLGSSTGGSFSLTFPDPGIYPVTQLVSNACECQDQSTIYVHVLPLEGAVIDCLSSVCQGDTVTYQTTIDCAPYNWQIGSNATIVSGGQSTSPFVQVVWNQGINGAVSISHNCSASCPTPTVQNIAILGDQTRIEGPVNICEGVTYQYSVPTYDGSIIEWTAADFGTIIDGQGTSQISINYPFFVATPFVAVRIQDCTRGCIIEDTLFQNPTFNFNIFGTQTACPEEEIFWQAQSSGLPVSSRWEIRDINNQIVSQINTPNGELNTVLTTPGIYSITGIANNNIYCLPSETKQITILDRPTVPSIIVGANTFCPFQFSVFHLDNATLQSEQVIWEVNRDGATEVIISDTLRVRWEDEQNPTVRAYIRNVVNGCESESISLNLTREQAFNWSFLDTVCNYSISDINLDIIPNTTPTWTLNPASSGVLIAGSSPDRMQIKWQEEGQNTVTVTYCGHTLTQNIQVEGEFTPSLLNTTNCGSTPAQVTTGENYNSYQWYSEGQLVSTQASAFLLGNNNLLLVTNDIGCRGKVNFDITRIKGLNIEIITRSSPGFCPPQSVTIESNQLPNTDYIFTWYLDGQPIGNDPTSVNATLPGNYQLEAVDIVSGCIYLSNIQVICQFCESGSQVVTCPGTGGGGSGGGSSCNPTVPLLLSVSPTTNCNEFIFEIANVNIIPSSVVWYINDGQIQRTFLGQSVTYRYQSIGRHSYWVQGSVIDSNGDTIHLCPIRNFAEINEGIEIDWIVRCEGDPVNFELINNGFPLSNIQSITWDMGDPNGGPTNQSNQISPSHLFSEAGNFQVSLSIELISGCSLNRDTTIIIRPAPNANFGLDSPRCLETIVNAFAFQSNALHYWTFDRLNHPNAIQDITNPTGFLYSQAGSYEVQLIIEDYRGCRDTTIREVNVLTIPEDIDIVVNSPLPVCEGEDVSLGVYFDPSYLYQWSNGSNSAQALVNTSGDYTVTVTDPVLGCSVLDTISLELLPKPFVELRAFAIDGVSEFSDDTLVVCAGTTLLIQPFGGRVSDGYLWNGGQTSTSLILDGVTEPFLPLGLHEIFLTLTDQFSSCSYTSIPIYIRVINSPEKPQLDILPGTVLCSGNNNSINITNVGPSIFYLWNTGTVGTSINTNLAGTYFVTATNTIGCTTRSDQVFVRPLPDLSFVPKGCFEACELLPICIPVPDFYRWISWTRDGEQLPIPGDIFNISLDSSGLYVATFANQYGCTASSTPISVDIFNETTSLSGLIFLDRDEDGILTSPDSLLGNISVSLVDQDGNIIQIIVTNDQGRYIFENLTSGVYTIRVDRNSLQENWSIVMEETEVELEACGPEFIVDPFIILECRSAEIEINIRLCEGEIFEIDNFVFTEDTIYIQSTFIDACLFTNVFDIQFLPRPDSVYLFFFACVGDVIDFDDQQITTDTTIYVQDNSDCPAITSNRFVFREEIEVPLTYTLCGGDTLFVFDRILTTDTILTIRQINPLGCDSIFRIEVSLQSDWNVMAVSTSECIGLRRGAVDLNYTGIEISNLRAISWDGNEIEPTNRIENLQSGNYVFNILDIFGCAQDIEVVIDQIPMIDATIRTSQLDCNFNEATLTINFEQPIETLQISSIIWSTGEEGNEITVNNSGRYDVLITNACQELNLVTDVENAGLSESASFYVPNAFSPNDDEINEAFKVYFPENTEVLSFEFEIFDRWGNRMYNSNDYREGWSGFHRGRKAELAMYVWTLRSSIRQCGQIFSIKTFGEVVLLK